PPLATSGSPNSARIFTSASTPSEGTLLAVNRAGNPAPVGAEFLTGMSVRAKNERGGPAVSVAELSSTSVGKALIRIGRSCTVLPPVGDAQDAILLGRSGSLVSDRRQVPLKELFRNRLGEDVVLPCRISERHNAVRFSASERNVEQSRGLVFFCLIRATDRVEVPQSVLQRVVAFEYARQIPQSTIR